MGFYISILGFIQAIVLAIYSRKHFRGNLFLAIFFFVFSLHEFTFYCVHVSGSLTLGAISLMHFAPLFMLIGPSFYFYVKSLVVSDLKLQKKDFLHLIPSLLLLLLLFSYYVKPYSEKEELVSQIRSNFQLYFNPLNLIVSQSFIDFFSALSIVSYLSVALVMYRHKLCFIQCNYMRNVQCRIWFVFTFSCSLLIAFIYLLATVEFLLFGHVAWITPDSILVSSLFFLLNVILLLYPHILHGRLCDDLEFDELSAAPFQMRADVDEEKSALNADLHLFNSEYILKIQDELESIIENNEIIHSKMSRSYLSNLTGIPVHHLSYYFSSILKISFTDWRNEKRIQYAKKLMESTLIQSQTLDSIATQSGFSNRQSFISSFKKYTMMTPKEYVMRLKNGQRDTFPFTGSC